MNILIGANNTGKSRFLRTLFADRDFKFEISEFDSIAISKIFTLILHDLDTDLGNIGYEEVSSQNISGLKATLKTHIENLSVLSLKDVNNIRRRCWYAAWVKQPSVPTTRRTFV